jgi:hypothetical protein
MLLVVGGLLPSERDYSAKVAKKMCRHTFCSLSFSLSFANLYIFNVVHRKGVGQKKSAGWKACAFFCLLLSDILIRNGR